MTEQDKSYYRMRDCIREEMAKREPLLGNITGEVMSFAKAYAAAQVAAKDAEVAALKAENERLRSGILAIAVRQQSHVDSDFEEVLNLKAIASALLSPAEPEKEDAGKDSGRGRNLSPAAPYEFSRISFSYDSFLSQD